MASAVGAAGGCEGPPGSSGIPGTVRRRRRKKRQGRRSGSAGKRDSSGEQAREAGRKFAVATREYEEKHGEYERLRGLFLEIQAGILAREELKPGKPCPVCGSTEHPSPCVLPEGHQDLTRETLENRRKETERLRTAQEKASLDSQTAGRLWREKRTGCEEGRRNAVPEAGRNSFPDGRKNRPVPDCQRAERTTDRMPERQKKEKRRQRKRPLQIRKSCVWSRRGNRSAPGGVNWSRKKSG